MNIDKVFEALERLKTAPSFMGGTEQYMFAMNSGSRLLEDYELVKQAITELKAIKGANPSEALEMLEDISKEEIVVRDRSTTIYMNPNDNGKGAFTHLTTVGVNFKGTIETIKQALLGAQEDKKKADALKELIKNHIEFVIEEDRCYFKIKNSKGKEKSFTSYTMLDFWKYESGKNKG